MSDRRTLIQRLAVAAPSLQPWTERFLALGYLDDYWLHLACELVRRAKDDEIPELSAIAALLDEALKSDENDHDEVGIGFVETLIAEAEEQRLDTARLRYALGPLARQTWDALSDYLHQNDWALVHFQPKAIANIVRPPARFEHWTAKAGERLAAQDSVARITSGGEPYDLRTTLPCRIGRFAVADGHELSEGDLLFYVLPDDYREFRRVEPYVALNPSGANAAA